MSIRCCCYKRHEEADGSTQMMTKGQWKASVMVENENILLDVEQPGQAGYFSTKWLVDLFRVSYNIISFDRFCFMI